MTPILQNLDTEKMRDAMVAELRLTLVNILIEGYPYEYIKENLELVFSKDSIGLYMGNILIREYREGGYMECFFEEVIYRQYSPFRAVQIKQLWLSLESFP